MIDSDARYEPTPGPFDFVMLGADIGIYALARAFHERYGVVTTLVCRAATGPVERSNLIRPINLGAAATMDEIAQTVIELGRQRPAGRKALLIANADSYVRLIGRYREELSQYYTLSLPTEQILDQVTDKGEFAHLCEELEIPTPRTIVVDFAASSDDGWAPPPVDLPFPVVAKAAASSSYEQLKFDGKKKVYFIQDDAGLQELYATLRAAGFTDRFVVQELIPGDDTAMRSVTLYRDSTGVTTLMCSAHVLLEEHTPLALGNPCAMITTPFPSLWEHGIRMLDHLDYEGFANFDIKVDPRDGRELFLEVNPRIGRNNYYVTAAGANVAEFLVSDKLDGQRHPVVKVTNEILYSVVPLFLLLRYIADPGLKAKVKRVARRKTVNPLWNPRPEPLWRSYYAIGAKVNQVRKFRTHYPRLTDHGF